jgi:hypothetical protein
MMALTPINLGSAPNDGKGDNLRTAGTKINANFANIEATLGAIPGGASGDGFPTVQAVLSNATMTYGEGPNQITASQIVRAHEQEVRFKVAASGASDHDMTTAGGVKLYVLPGADGHLPAAAFGYLANNNQSAAAGNYTALNKAMRAGSTQKRLVSIPVGVGFVNRGFRYDRDNYRFSGVIGLGPRGSCVIKYADTLTASGGDRTWMIQLHATGTDGFHFTLKNVTLDGNYGGNKEFGTTGIRMNEGFAEHVLIEDVDTHSFYYSGRELMGGRTEGAVTDRNGRAWNMIDQHGFATRGNMNNFGTPVVFENPVAWNCRGYPLDVSRGKAVILGRAEFSHDAATGPANNSGGFKMSADGSNPASNYAESLVADTIIVNNALQHGFLNTLGETPLPAEVEIKRLEVYGCGAAAAESQAFHARLNYLTRLGTAIFKDNLQRDMELRSQRVDIDEIILENSAVGDGDATFNQRHSIAIWGPVRFVRIGRLIAHNNQSRVLFIRPGADTATVACVVEIEYLELVNNNRNGNTNSAFSLIEVSSQFHPIYMRIRDGMAYDTRGTPLQTRIFRAVATGNRAARINIDRFVFGAGAQSGGRISTSGTGASITVGESIGV